MPDDEDESPAINANERTKNRKMGRLGALIGAVDVGSVRYFPPFSSDRLVKGMI